MVNYMEDTVERMLPQSIEAEQAVLGAMLIDQQAVEYATEELVPQDFYRAANQKIFTAMLRLTARSEAVDQVTVIEELKQAGELEKAGGIEYVLQLTHVVATAHNVRYHCAIVADKASRRQLIEGATKIAAEGYEAEGETKEIIDKAEQTILQVANRKKRQDFTLMENLVMNSVTSLEKMMERKGGITGIATGFSDLDNLTAGLHPADFVILAARPSMGKTALALNIVTNVAIRGRRPVDQRKERFPDGKPDDGKYTVAMFSLEMSAEQLVQRMLCSEAGVNSQALRMGQLDKTAWERLWPAADQLSEARIYIDDTAGVTAFDMRSKARRLKTQHGLDLIVVDYLQLMQGSGKSRNQDNRQQEVSEISRSLKLLARELEVPVIALSQLSRSVENRQVKKPMLSDLRESGSLEQDADLVAFLYRADYYKQQDEEMTNTTELIIAKHRNGPIGTINLFFDNECTRFREMTGRPEGS